MKELLVALAIVTTFMMSACNSDAEKVCAIWNDGQCMAWTDGATDGQDGIDGQDGLSAYELAVVGGFQGTEEEWLESLKGDAGDAGEPGVDGANGLDGLSAYELAVVAGFEGTLEEWLVSLVGEPGADGKPGAPGECPCQCEDGNCTCDSNSTIPPVEPPVLCPPLLDINDSDIHFLIWFDREDLGEYQMQHLIEAGYVPTLNASLSAPVTIEDPKGPGVDEPGMKVIDRDGTTIIYSVMPLLDNTMEGSLQHGMGLNFVQEVAPQVEPK